MCEICKSLHEFPWRFLRWMLHVLRQDEWHWHRQKAATLYNQENDKIAIRATLYYIFCCRNRNWDSPGFKCNFEFFYYYYYYYLFIYFFYFWLLFCFVFVFVFVFVCLFFLVCFFFLIILSQAALVNCLYITRFTIVHSKTQIKFPLLLYYAHTMKLGGIKYHHLCARRVIWNLRWS